MRILDWKHHITDIGSPINIANQFDYNDYLTPEFIERTLAAVERHAPNMYMRQFFLNVRLLAPQLIEKYRTRMKDLFQSSIMERSQHPSERYHKQAIGVLLFPESADEFKLSAEDEQKIIDIVEFSVPQNQLQSQNLITTMFILKVAQPDRDIWSLIHADAKLKIRELIQQLMHDVIGTLSLANIINLLIVAPESLDGLGVHNYLMSKMDLAGKPNELEIFWAVLLSTTLISNPLAKVTSNGLVVSSETKNGSHPLPDALNY